MNKILLALLVTVFIGCEGDAVVKGNFNAGKVGQDMMGNKYLITSNGCIPFKHVCDDSCMPELPPLVDPRSVREIKTNRVESKQTEKEFTRDGCQYFYIFVSYPARIGVGMGITHKGNCTNHKESRR